MILLYNHWIIGKKEQPWKRAELAEVVGSNPTKFIFIDLLKYGIRISTFFDLGHLRLMIEFFYPLFLS